MNIQGDNLTVRVNEYGETIVEPQYIEYLRESGFTIESVQEPHVVPSESEKGKGYLVMKVQTYEYPKDHPELDIATSDITIPVCSCWSYRQNSTDVQESYPPEGRCKHTRQAYREQRARDDKNQETLV